MIRMSTKARARNYLVKQLDALARVRCFERDLYKCVRCQSKNGIQWAHIVSRRHLSLRWDLDNNLTLCGGCHLFWHHEPIQAVKWFEETWPGRYEHLLAASAIKQTVDLRLLLEGFKAEERIQQ